MLLPLGAGETIVAHNDGTNVRHVSHTGVMRTLWRDCLKWLGAEAEQV